MLVQDTPRKTLPPKTLLANASRVGHLGLYQRQSVEKKTQMGPALTPSFFFVKDLQLPLETRFSFALLLLVTLDSIIIFSGE